MTSPGGAGPTLSQVRTWDTEHLIAAAAHWTKTATVWEHHFTHFATQISFPGGMPWEGEAAEAAQQLAYSDKMTVIAIADQLHSASAIAKAGEREINEARRGVLRIVEAAEEAGFTVGEDFSVTDPNFYDRMTAAARQARAEVIATSLRAAVGTLVAADVRVAGELISSTTDLGSNPFPEDNDGPTPGSIGDTIQLVNSHKKDGGPTPAPEPTPSPSAGAQTGLNPEDLKPIGAQGDVIEGASKEAKKHSTGLAAEMFGASESQGKFWSRLGVVGELWSGGREISSEIEEGKSVRDAIIDVAPKTLAGIAGSWGGSALGAGGGAFAALAATDGPEMPFLGEAPAKGLAAIAAAGTGALVLGQYGGEVGEAIGEDISDAIREALN